MKVSGTFDVTAAHEPPFEAIDGVTLGRSRFDKRFSGALSGTGAVQMLSARTATPNSAGYVAVERVSGKLDGKEGTFVLLHMGVMTRGSPSLIITVVPDSGTGALAGLVGSMQIRVEDGKHHYDFDYSLP